MTRKLGNAILILQENLAKGVKMEDNENKPAKTTEEVNERLARDEILASSRKENKTGDEREQNLYGKGIQIAYSIGILFISIISIVNTIVLDKTPIELWIVYAAMTAVSSLYYAVRVGKHKPLFLACGIICGIACVFFTVMWILELCGVAL